MKDKKYWHDKHPIVNQLYEGRPLPGTKRSYKMDVRRFIWVDDPTLSHIYNSFSSQDINSIAIQAQNWVVRHIKYTADVELGANEFWLFPLETISLSKGDCEDGAILLSSLLISALPSEERWRVRVNCGLVKTPEGGNGGHAYCCFCRPLDNEWVILDWCYYEDSSVPIESKVLAKNQDKYLSVWFSFNNYFSWSHENRTVKKRL